jgi:hypothetical protein
MKAAFDNKKVAESMWRRLQEHFPDADAQVACFHSAKEKAWIFDFELDLHGFDEPLVHTGAVKDSPYSHNVAFMRGAIEEMFRQAVHCLLTQSGRRP